MTADFALVGVNWLLIGALLTPFGGLPSEIEGLDAAMGSPFVWLGFALLQGSLITLIAHVEGLYGETDLRRQREILANSVFWSTVALSIGDGLQGAPWSSGVLFGAAGLLHFLSLSAWRWQRARKERRIDPSGDLRNVLIVGGGPVARRVACYVEGSVAHRRTVYGFLDDEKPLGDGVIGRVKDLARLARTGFVDEVILAAPHDRNLAQQVIREAKQLRLDVKIIPDLFGYKPVSGEIETLADLPAICLNAERSPTTALLVKRLLDIAGAGCAVVILSPVFAAIAALIKLDSTGPVLYRAQRVGRKGHPFHCYKFRSMVVNADDLKERLRERNQRSGPFFKIADDPRITRVGRFLRRYSLDELPQLWNVLRGDMSLVGPRPHPLDDFAGYETGHLARLDVTPGITGLWQVTARRDPSFQRGLELDREYIRTWNLKLDLQILLKTVVAVIGGGGA